MNIVFVCNANMFRSVSAHYLLENYLKEHKIKGINVSSAGIVAHKGEKADKNIILQFKKRGIDISKHRTTPLTREIIEKADIIIAMSENHRKYIFDNYCIKVPLFNEVAYNKNVDIKDNNEVVKDFKNNKDKFYTYENDVLDYISKAIPKLISNIKKYVKKFHNAENCKFCRFIRGKDLYHNNKFPFIKIFETKKSISFLSVDIPKNQNLHILVVPKKHYTYLEDMPKSSSNDLMEHLKIIITKVRKKHGGCNILLNDGGAAGQFIFHTHFHIIPRDENDHIDAESWERGKISKSRFVKMSNQIQKMLNRG